MGETKFTPFSENALWRIAQIIIEKYQGTQTEDYQSTPVQPSTTYHPTPRNVRGFFMRAGYDQGYFDFGKQVDIVRFLHAIQLFPDGRQRIIYIIERLCDPEEYFNDPSSRKVIIKKLNEVLIRYNLKVFDYGYGMPYNKVITTSPLLEAFSQLSSSMNKRSEDLLLEDEEEDLTDEQQKVFVCYSHKDIRWLKQLQVHLKPLERQGVIQLWDDTKIPAGAITKKEIEDAVKTATIAVPLVSPNFLASDFISEYELPVLLASAKNKGTKILSVILSHCLFEGSGLDIFQAVNSPSSPLSDMSRGEQDKTWVGLAKAIQKSLQQEVS